MARSAKEIGNISGDFTINDHVDVVEQYSTRQPQTTIQENFSGLGFDASIWEVYSGNIVQESGSVGGAYSLKLAGSTATDTRYIRTKDTVGANIKLSFRIIAGTYSELALEKPDMNNDVYVQYSYDKTVWTTIYADTLIEDGTESTDGTMRFKAIKLNSDGPYHGWREVTASIALPPPGRVYVRWVQETAATTNDDNWALDELAITHSDVVVNVPFLIQDNPIVEVGARAGVRSYRSVIK